MRTWNLLVYVWSALMMAMEITNLVLSLIALVRATHLSAGNAAVAQVFANVLLVIGQAYTYFSNAKNSFHNDMAVSCLATEPKADNTVDPSYKFAKGCVLRPFFPCRTALTRCRLPSAAAQVLCRACARGRLRQRAGGVVVAAGVVTSTGSRRVRKPSFLSPHAASPHARKPCASSASQLIDCAPSRATRS